MKKIVCKVCVAVLLIFVSMLLLAGRKKYIMEFHNLALNQFEEFALPETIRDCKVEIIVSRRKFDINQYKAIVNEKVAYWNNEDVDGSLIAPNIDAKITVFNDSGAKCFEFICKGDNDYGSEEWWEAKITKLTAWDSGCIICKAKGDIKSNGSVKYYLVGGTLKIYDYANEDKYLKKKNRTRGYFEGCNDYRRYITEYYPSGKIAHKIEKNVSKEDSYESINGYVDNKVEEVYLKEDGTEMSLVDRLFLNIDDFLIFKTDKYGVRYKYIAILPKSSSNRSGHIVGFSSSRGISNNILVVAYCDYLVYDNSIECSNFRDSNRMGKWENSPYASKIYIDIEDTDDGIMLKSQNNTKQWFDNANFTIYNTSNLDLQTRQFLKEAFNAYVTENWSWIWKH